MLPGDLRDDLETELERVIDGASFFQRENPFVRHVVLRKRATLESRGLLDKIAVNVHPEEGLVKDPHRFNALFQGIALRATPEFDRAYEEARAFGKVLARRGKGGGFMKNLMEQRVCSSVVAGINTAGTLLEGRQVREETEDEEIELDLQSDAERGALESLIAALNSMSDRSEAPGDPVLPERRRGVAGSRLHHLQPIPRHGPVGGRLLGGGAAGRDHRTLCRRGSQPPVPGGRRRPRRP